MHELIEILLQFSQSIGYLGVILLMTIESSFIPFPSEIVIPPAAFLASLGEFNIIFVILAGIFGSLLGATINYWLAYSLGRKAIYSLVKLKFFKLILLDEKKISKAEEYFLRHGKSSTFIGRFIPAVRQLISIPAGFSKMNFKDFLFYTFLGSGIWVIILAIIGYIFGANQEIILKYYNSFKEIVWGLLLLLLIIFVVLKILKKYRKKRLDFF